MAYKWSEMTPRERDALVAEKVMGVETSDGKIVCDRCGGSGFSGRGTGYDDPCDCTGGYVALIPRYTTDISAAWEVVYKMCDCLHLKEHGIEGRWCAMFCGMNDDWSHADIAPEAICLAALCAVGVDIE